MKGLTETSEERYEAPQIEQVVEEAELDRQAQYAGAQADGSVLAGIG
jgi:hypothetical protein